MTGMTGTTGTSATDDGATAAPIACSRCADDGQATRRYRVLSDILNAS
jgi:hypothetical protein